MQWPLGGKSGKKSSGKNSTNPDGASGSFSSRDSSRAGVLDERIAVLHTDAHEEGGLACNNEELLKCQQKAITKWMKGMGRKLLQGNLNLINTPFPVDIFEPRSYLEKLADVWVYPRYLRQAAASADPLERLQFVITWFIAGLHHSFEKWKKPFNPILGETWQASLSDGSLIFMEQISHHPPVSAFHIEGPGGEYRFVGLSEPTVSILLMQGGFKTVAKGTRCVEFPDGTHIDIVYPAYCMKGIANSTLGSIGIAAGKPRAVVEGTAVFTDCQHCLRAVVRFGANKTAGGANKYTLRRADAVHGEVYDTRDQMDALNRQGTKKLEPEPEEPKPSAEAAVEDDFESASETDWDMRADSDEPEAVLSGQTNVVTSQSFPSLAVVASEAERAGSSGNDARPGTGTGGGKSMLGKIFGYSNGSSQPSPLKAEEQQAGRVVSRLQGSWLSHLDFDGVRFWAWADERPDKWESVKHPLPSDSRFREDLVMLANGTDLKVAQEAKEKLEKMQRNDKKLREQY